MNKSLIEKQKELINDNKKFKEENDLLKLRIEKIDKDLNEKKNELSTMSSKMSEINNEIQDKKRELDTIQSNLNTIERIYGSNIFEKLKLFRGHKLLEMYISNTYIINKRSNESIELPSDLKEYFKENFNLKHDPKLFMDHILFNFMRQDAISLMNVVDYEITKDKPVNLLSSYSKSIELAKKLNNEEGSLAWYINQRIPKTYIEANSVDYHLDNIFELFYEKPLIDVRRIHLFYKKYFIKNIYSTIPFKNTQALFNTLLLEYLHGIDSRVLCIENYDNVKKILFEKGDNFANNFLFLLDFVLYFSKTVTSSKDYLTGEPHILCADFIAEDPTELEGKTVDEEFTIRTDEYEKDKVYDFDSPLIYSIFKNYFLSIWNLDKYVNYLDEYLKDKCKKENHLELRKLYETIKKDIKIYNFVEFWRKAKDSYGDANLLEETIFDSKYLWKKYNMNGRTKKDILQNIREIISSFDIPKDNNEAELKLKELFQKDGFILREIHTNICYK